MGIVINEIEKKKNKNVGGFLEYCINDIKYDLFFTETDELKKKRLENLFKIQTDFQRHITYRTFKSLIKKGVMDENESVIKGGVKNEKTLY